MNTQNSPIKSSIYFSRPYRHLKPDNKTSLIFMLGFILPCLVFFLLYYTKISYLMTFGVRKVLSVIIPSGSLGIAYGEFIPLFGGVYYVRIPTTLPNFKELAANLVVTLLLLYVCLTMAKKNKVGMPLYFYFIIILFTHLASIVFFLFAKHSFPYSATQYSELYIKQQISIWIALITISGIVIGILGYGKLVDRLAAFFSIMLYSFIFGWVRCLTFMFVISGWSSLYMAVLFFTLGPMFDFLYLVCFYSIFINAQIRNFNQGEGRSRWQWL